MSSTLHLSQLPTQNNQPYYVVGNDHDGDLYKSTSLLDCYKYIASEKLEEWYSSRDYIPAKSNFEINERVLESWNGMSKQKLLVKAKASKLFPNIVKITHLKGGGIKIN